MARLFPGCAEGVASSAPAPSARPVKPSPVSVTQAPLTNVYTHRARLLARSPPDCVASLDVVRLARFPPGSVTQVPVAVNRAADGALLASPAPDDAPFASRVPAFTGVSRWQSEAHWSENMFPNPRTIREQKPEPAEGSRTEEQRADSFLAKQTIPREYDRLPQRCRRGRLTSKILRSSPTGAPNVPSRPTGVLVVGGGPILGPSVPAIVSEGTSCFSLNNSAPPPPPR